MDQVVSDRLRAERRLERLLAALDAGVIMLDSDRQIVWMDQATRMRLNGGIGELQSALHDVELVGDVRRSLTAHQVTINGQAAMICLIHESADHTEQGLDAVAAVEAALADTSWFTRTIIEKLKALRQTKGPSPRTGDLELLSDREREVLGLICEGRSDAQMSEMLGLSQNTVRNHIASLYRKIGVNRRTAAIIWAHERGITAQDALSARRRSRPRPNHPQQ
jgi:DNA-binding NarL/FixJ family response regulator